VIRSPRWAFPFSFTLIRNEPIADRSVLPLKRKYRKEDGHAEEEPVAIERIAPYRTVGAESCDHQERNHYCRDRLYRGRQPGDQFQGQSEVGAPKGGMTIFRPAFFRSREFSDPRFLFALLEGTCRFCWACPAQPRDLPGYAGGRFRGPEAGKGRTLSFRAPVRGLGNLVNSRLPREFVLSELSSFLSIMGDLKGAKTFSPRTASRERCV